MVKKIILVSSILLLLSGCFYSVYSNAHPHLKKIKVEPFENLTTEFALADKALNELAFKIQSDGRLKTVTVDADCVLEGKISSFEEKIYSYNSANQVQDYQISVVLDIKFTDLTKNEVLYQNSGLRLSENYKVAEGSTAKYESKEEALSEIFTNIFKQVIQNTLEAW